MVLMAFVLGGCVSSKLPKTGYESDNLKIEWINNNIARHISYLKTEDYGRVACNGMVYFNNDEAIIFDTPTDNDSSAELIEWVGKEKIKAVIITHFHEDCLGGLQQFHGNDIQSYASNLTIALAKTNNDVLPQIGFEKRLEITLGNQSAVAEYFGQGHTHDNIVGHIPSQKTLFGGCLIKSLKAGKGNLADANTIDWPKTVEKIKRTYPELEIVVPGHGKPGGPELLDYTIALFTGQ